MLNFMMTLLVCSVTMSVLGLFYMAIMPLIAKRYSVRSCYYAWLFIVAGLMIPFRPHIDNAIVNVDVPGNGAAPMIRVGSGAPVVLSGENALSSAVSNGSWWQIAAAVWLAGFVLYLAYSIIKHYHFLKLTARWSQTVTDEKQLIYLQALKAQMGLSKEIGLQVCDCIGSPMLIGFANPRILLPKADFATEELHFIFQHELVHYKRKDLWYKCLVLLAVAVHWFNPIVYFIAKAIDRQCEFSCDEEVVRHTGADARQCYSETMIGVARYHSKLKTALSTNFYGGKKGMKQRIFSIMDMRKKKAGFAVLCGMLMLTLGTGFAFAAKAETQNQPTHIKEEIRISAEFLPNPATYAPYASYGITISEDGKRLLYNGQSVRLFADEASEAEAFFLNDAGALDLAVTRNTAGNIIGIERISAQKAQDYRSAFFDDDLSAASTPEEIPQEIAKEVVADTAKETVGQSKYEQYSAYGILLSADEKSLLYNGQRVKLLADMHSDGSFETYWSDEAGTVLLSVVRNAAGQITAIEPITEKQAKEYGSALEAYEQNALSGLNEKVEKRMKERLSEN